MKGLCLDKKVKCKLVKLLHNWLEGIHESGQLDKPLRTVGLSAAVNEAIQFIYVGIPQIIKVLLIFQTLHWDDTEEEQCLHAEELLMSDLEQDKLLGHVPHPDAVLVHAGDTHPAVVEYKVRSKVQHSGIHIFVGPPS